MTARTHDAFAFATLITVSAFYQPQSLNLATFLVCIIGADIGALMPDMDQAGNRLWDLLPAGHQVGKILRKVFYKHRTLSHSLIGLFAVYKILEWLLVKLLNPSFLDARLVLYAVMVGYISHLIADSLTEEGLPLLFPIPISFGFPPIKKMRIKTGKWFEKLVIYPAIWIYLVWFVVKFQDKLINILRLVNS